MLLFPQCFQTLSSTKIIYLATFILLTTNAISLDQTEIVSFGKELNSANDNIKALHPEHLYCHLNGNGLNICDGKTVSIRK